jgi:hypothetical protein
MPDELPVTAAPCPQCGQLLPNEAEACPVCGAKRTAAKKTWLAALAPGPSRVPRLPLPWHARAAGAVLISHLLLLSAWDHFFPDTVQGGFAVVWDLLLGVLLLAGNSQVWFFAQLVTGAGAVYGALTLIISGDRLAGILIFAYALGVLGLLADRPSRMRLVASFIVVFGALAFQIVALTCTVLATR